MGNGAIAVVIVIILAYLKLIRKPPLQDHYQNGRGQNETSESKLSIEIHTLGQSHYSYE